MMIYHMYSTNTNMAINHMLCLVFLCLGPYEWNIETEFPLLKGTNNVVLKPQLSLYNMPRSLVWQNNKTGTQFKKHCVNQ